MSLADYPLFGRYKPSKDLIHYYPWVKSGYSFMDWTDYNWDWYELYYARSHENVPNDENIYDLQYKWHGNYTDKLWAL